MSHPIIKMLSWKTRLLSEEEIIQVLAAIANINLNEFMLKDIINFLPEKISNDKRKRRSISSFLETLVEIGYLKKPSERKWSKVTSSLSHFLSPLLLELSELERKPIKKEEEEKRVIKFS